MTPKKPQTKDLFAPERSDTPDGYRVLSVTARNLKCIREAHIDLDGNVHEIRGDSGQGKSAWLAAIEGGLRSIDPELVRNGADSAEVIIDLGRAIVYHRAPSADAKANGMKETVSITEADGTPIAAAKEFLGALVGPSAFRPIEWVNLGGGDAKGRTPRLRQQRDELLKALPLAITPEQIVSAIVDLGEAPAAAWDAIDLPDIDFAVHPFDLVAELERYAYDHRARLNALAEEAESKALAYPAPETLPAGSVYEIAQAMEAADARYYAAQSQGNAVEQSRARAESLRARIASLGSLPPYAEIQARAQAATELRDQIRLEIAELETELQAKRQELEGVRETVAEWTAIATNRITLDETQDELAQIEAAGIAAPPDLEALTADRETARRRYAAAQAQAAHDAAAQAAAQARARADALTPVVKLFRDELPKRLLETAHLPVPGLQIEPDHIAIDGVPLHQLGTSEQIKVGVAIARTLSPSFRTILIDRAESLGRADRLAIAQMAHEQDFGIVLTYVDPDATPGPGVTVMQDGKAL